MRTYVKMSMFLLVSFLMLPLASAENLAFWGYEIPMTVNGVEYDFEWAGLGGRTMDCAYNPLTGMPDVAIAAMHWNEAETEQYMNVIYSRFDVQLDSYVSEVAYDAFWTTSDTGPTKNRWYSDLTMDISSTGEVIVSFGYIHTEARTTLYPGAVNNQHRKWGSVFFISRDLFGIWSDLGQNYIINRHLPNDLPYYIGPGYMDLHADDKIEVKCVYTNADIPVLVYAYAFKGNDGVITNRSRKYLYINGNLNTYVVLSAMSTSDPLKSRYPVYIDITDDPLADPYTLDSIKVFRFLRIYNTVFPYIDLDLTTFAVTPAYIDSTLRITSLGLPHLGTQYTSNNVSYFGVLTLNSALEWEIQNSKSLSTVGYDRIYLGGIDSYRILATKISTQTPLMSSCAVPDQWGNWNDLSYIQDMNTHSRNVISESIFGVENNPAGRDFFATLRDGNVYICIEADAYVPVDYSSIQSAIDNAFDDWKIALLPGVYTEYINVDRDIILSSYDRRGMISDYDTCIINPSSHSGPTVQLAGTTSSKCVIEHLTIQGGSQGWGLFGRGGAIACDGSQATIRRNLIEGNIGYQVCGITSPGGLIEKNIFTRNRGLWDSMQYAVIGNESQSGSIPDLSPVIVNNLFYENGIDLQNSTIITTAINMSFTSGALVANNTLVNNLGGGIYETGGGNILNNIVWGDSHSIITTSATLLNNCIDPQYAPLPHVAGNIYPQSPGISQTFKLQYNSVCRDGGVTVPVVIDDIDYEVRPYGTAYDIGADEFTTLFP